MVRFSLGYAAVCEVLLGAVLLLYFLIGILLAYTEHKHTFVILAGSMAMALIGVFCVWAAISLLRCARWAWFTALGLGLLVVALGILSIHDAYYPPPNSVDAYFGFLYGPILIAISLVGLVLLNLPKTRNFILAGNADFYAAD